MPVYSILGPLEVRVGGVLVEVARPRRRAVLTYLLLHANDRVDVEQLIDALWAEGTPRTARAQIHTAVSALKAALPEELRTGLVSEATGYRLWVGAEDLDLAVFRQRLASARGCPGIGAESEQARRALRSALALWRGPALAGVDAPFVEPARARLEEERFSAYEALADGEMAAGRHAELIPLLTGLLNEYPARESIVRRLALSLYRAGRKTDALAVVRRLRVLLAKEYGLDPEKGIVDLENAMLRGDLALDAREVGSEGRSEGRSEGVRSEGRPDADLRAGAAVASEVAAPEAATGGEKSAPPSPAPPRQAAPLQPTWPRPAQLPPPTAGFVGRDHELTRLARLLTSESDAPRAAAVTGPAGVGKTSLALIWAHEHAGAFPDGQLFVDLHGYDHSEAESPEGVLERFLLALGIPGHQIPPGLPKREDLFRSAMAERRMLLVLDNARDYRQISPLLPGSAHTRTLITSRIRLGSLVADTGALPVPLDVLPLEESVEVLTRIVGAESVAAAPQSARDLARLCGGLPLALRISAVRLLEEPAAGLTGLATELSPEADRLHGLGLLDGGHTVSHALENSCRRLTAAQIRLFRLLCLHPGDSVGAAAAQAMVDQGDLRFTAHVEVRHLLRVLETVHLVDRTAADRYRMHDLVRLYGRGLSGLDDADQTQDSLALQRLLDWYINVAQAAHRVLAPAMPALPMDVRHSLTDNPTPFPDESAALDWFDQEAANLIALTKSAAEHGDHRGVWQLAIALGAYLSRRHRVDALVQTQALGEQAALAEAHHAAAAALANNLGIAHAMRRDPEAAQQPFERAVAAYRDLGDRQRAAQISANLGSLRYDLGMPHEAAAAHSAAIETLREFGDSPALSAVLANLGLTVGDLGRHEQARDLFREAIGVAEACGSDYRAGYARSQLAWTLLRLGEADEGLELSRETLAYALTIGDPLLAGRMHDQIGIAQAMRGAWDEARAAWEEAVATLTGIGSSEADVVRARLRGEPDALPAVGADGKPNVAALPSR
ncbi:transcriptional regulator, SARP family [Catenulispora acidiphila DSM 44928]|uniref:Transcriptional regulator, SARP family n=1 Tax=Catenulispora acidiphila (strain DSM 44928 / JCM 14897 / NBRC 102108 / NRRL B-24433 / ID139908) TaxID=479433 RepID=C7PXN7_CATAD|nr:BTAD domain-containing putative transcriptional regulator [Catenulispora acidiphila]ACU71490.1 transcriptional regulator, SARP family [Catenulispora acidiphila DSM 44928]